MRYRDPRTSLPIQRYIADPRGNIAFEPLGGSTGIVPSELTEGDVTALRYPLAVLLYLVLGPHYFVFILSYIASELLVMRRIAPAPSLAQGGN
ncbi:hypothetical protein [Sinorhizobium saheli]|uniref:Uncharacterized protein n=1 Tax=Sinorhizobium saheli TaxID=36856 RepID=A0A178XHF5_SINSA|nr:hypothetical protein [Sinorhizobium saheli]OAP34142.1 hypothetical protein ATB98_22655 [Sinorhizobium saheli]